MTKMTWGLELHMTELSVLGFNLQKKVGEGAMSEVYLATDAQGQEVAVKLMRPFLRSDKAAWERMQREAEILSQLNHERIIKFHKLERSQDGRLALIQEFVHGDNLNVLWEQTKQHLKQQNNNLKGLPVTAMALVSEVLLGLEEAHRLQIIHRDLKPENLLLTAQGKIKITDFGIAKVLSNKDLTITGTIVGSPAYMSPEQLSEKALTASSDFFSLGVLLYQWSTGEFPFIGESYPGLTQAILNDTPKKPHELNPHIHPELSRIILKALHKDPNERYQKAYEFRYDLMRLWDQLELPSSFQVLTGFYQNQLDYEASLTDRLVRTLMTRALLVSKAPIKPSARHGELVQNLKQIFKLDPSHQAAQSLYLKIQRKALGRKLGSYGSVIVLLLFFAWYGFMRYQVPKTTVPVMTDQQFKPAKESIRSPALPAYEADKLATAASASVTAPIITESRSEKSKMTDEKMAINKPPKTKTQATNNRDVPVERTKEEVVDEPVSLKAAATERERPTARMKTISTRILFNVEEGVQVLVDNEDVTKKLGAAFEISPGSHRIQMVKAGFHPITSTVQVPEGETTIINARPNQP